MSRVTIDNIQHDASGLDNMSWAEITKLYQIEVVPRKMVEMIIAKCEVMKLQIIDNDYEKSVVCFNTCNSLKNYAESLLKQFEEEEETNFEITAEDLHDYMYGI